MADWERAEAPSDKTRLAAAVAGLFVASIAVLAAIAVVASVLTDGEDSATEIEAVGLDSNALISPSDVTRPASPQAAEFRVRGDLTIEQDGPAESTDDAITVGQSVGNESASDNAPSELADDATTSDVVTVEPAIVEPAAEGSTNAEAATPAQTPDGDKPADATTSSPSTTKQATTENTTPDQTTPESTTTQPSTTAAPTSTTAAPPPPATPTNSYGSAPGVNKKILYVDKRTGSGRNPGTKDKPFFRLIEATSVAEPGTTIYVRGGTYDTNTDGAFQIRRSGTPQNWIKIAAHPGERVELIGGGSVGSAFEVLGASYIEVADFVMKGRSDSINGSGVFIKDGAHDVRVINNNIRGFGGAGISVVKSSRVHIEGNEVRDNAHRSRSQGSGITLFQAAGPLAGNGGYSFVIRGNYVVRNYNAVRGGDGRITDGNCIILDKFDPVGYQGKTLIENNVCVENGGRGIHLYRASNALIRNNTMVRDVWTPEVEVGRGEMTVSHGTNVSFVNNLVFNRPGITSYISFNNTNTHFKNNLVTSGPPPGEGNREMSGDISKFFRSSDPNGPVDQYRPLSGAGLAGTSSGSQAANDYTGRQRPGKAAIGAFEP